jgi:RimJ/RimL family protein N-acetyltransferase
MYVLCIDNLPVGQIRFQKVNDAWSINYSLDEFVRGRGWGNFLVQRGIAEMKKSTTGKFIANVKVPNFESQKIFEQLGFYRNAQSDTDVDQFVLMP